MKVAELEGALLDYWVARAEGLTDADIIDHIPLIDEAPPSWCKAGGRHYRPSQSWGEGGPIIEREIIAICRDGTEWVALWRPEWWASSALTTSGPVMNGETALVAAMRCYIASKFGENVPELAA